MELKDKINSFPKTPGIYLMKDKNKNIIYVGKSKKLQERIKSYFANSTSHSRKVQRMVKGIADIEIITTDTELDALLLECDMIKKIRPMYNKLMKNHENYSYLKIDKDIKYPYIQVAKEIEDNKLYFGPYTIGKKLEDIKEIINEAYKIRSCKKMTKCFKYDLKKCMGPCRDNITKEDYKKIIDNLINDLKGCSNNIFDILENDMNNEVSKLNFEKAEEIKRKIDSVRSLFNKQDVINSSIEKENILAWIKMDEDYYKIYIFKKGILEKSEIKKSDLFNSLDKKVYLNNNLKHLEINNQGAKDKKLVDKFDIDFVNIVYFYIKYNEDIDYISN